MHAIFRIYAAARQRARLTDGFSFLYGGLHFGTSVSVQLAEVMARLLEPFAMDAGEKAKVLSRTNRPAFHLASVNVAQVVPAHHHLLAATDGTPWMDPARFVVQVVDDRPVRIGLGEEEFPGLAAIPTTYPTLGCPARVSPAGGASAIADLWAWTVELSHRLGFLG